MRTRGRVLLRECCEGRALEVVAILAPMDERRPGCAARYQECEREPARWPAWLARLWRKA
jgi:hypothetical protein